MASQAFTILLNRLTSVMLLLAITSGVRGQQIEGDTTNLKPDTSSHKIAALNNSLEQLENKLLLLDLYLNNTYYNVKGYSDFKSYSVRILGETQFWDQLDSDATGLNKKLVDILRQEKDKFLDNIRKTKPDSLSLSLSRYMQYKLAITKLQLFILQGRSYLFVNNIAYNIQKIDSTYKGTLNKTLHVDSQISVSTQYINTFVAAFNCKTKTIQTTLANLNTSITNIVGLDSEINKHALDISQKVVTLSKNVDTLNQSFTQARSYLDSLRTTQAQVASDLILIKKRQKRTPWFIAAAVLVVIGIVLAK